jgi:hypothetical protein
MAKDSQPDNNEARRGENCICCERTVLCNLSFA